MSEIFNLVKQASDNLDQSVVDSVFPAAFVERWSQYASHGAPMPKSAADVNALIDAAYEATKVATIQQRQGGNSFLYSRPVLKVSDMAKRAAASLGAQEVQYDLRAASNAMGQLLSL
jgi:L-fucose isomerase-like protein